MGPRERGLEGEVGVRDGVKVAAFIKVIDGMRGHAELFRLLDRGGISFVVVSAVAMDSGPETYIFEVVR